MSIKELTHGFQQGSMWLKLALLEIQMEVIALMDTMQYSIMVQTGADLLFASWKAFGHGLALRRALESS